MRTALHTCFLDRFRYGTCRAALRRRCFNRRKVLVLYSVSALHILSAEMDQLGNRNELIPSGMQLRNNRLASLCRGKVQGVHQHDISVLNLRKNTVLCLHRIPRAPVFRIDRPENKRFLDNCLDIITDISSRKSNQSRAHTGSLLYRIIRFIELISDIILTLTAQMNIMVIGMISDFMPALYRVFYIFRKFLNSLPHYKESGSSVHLF